MTTASILSLALLGLVPADDGGDAGRLARSLWLVHRHGTADAIRPDHDLVLKRTLARGLADDGSLSAVELAGLIDPATFARLAGGGSTLSSEAIAALMDTDTPASRRHLLPEVRAHAELLTTTFDQIDEPHREAGARLVDWILAHHTAGQPLHVTMICTGNSRRSMMGAALGNIAAAYYGLPEIRFHSGGTTPSAFNSRAIAALEGMGVEIVPSGAEAPRGEPSTPNPIYQVRWGADAERPMESVEFSKHYADPANPQRGFVALMVCDEADAACPIVEGAAVRIAMPYLDPKIYDGSRFEAAKYAERRDDLGRLMLAVMMQVSNRLSAR